MILRQAPYDTSSSAIKPYDTNRCNKIENKTVLFKNKYVPNYYRRIRKKYTVYRVKI